MAPGGAVAKITGKEGLGFTGKARTFDSEDEFVKAVEAGSIKKGEKTVIVLRYLGPKGGPGACCLVKFIGLCYLTPRPSIASLRTAYYRHAGDAQAYQPDHGSRTGQGRRMPH